MASDPSGDAKPSEEHREEQVQDPAPAHHEAEEEQPKQQQTPEEGEAVAKGDAEGGPVDLMDEPKKSTPKKRKRGRKSVGKSEPATPATDRPTRERKVVERYTASHSSGRTPGSKLLSIVKGSGTQLKDIPNVAFKLSKQKADDSLQALHTLLFGKKAKAHSLKRNIGQFSGFVWSDNEEKQRAKVREKLEKCVKEKLVYFCDVLNIPMNKAISKKEELSAKILEFLESPHTTTDVLLSEKGQKRKRRSSSSKSIERTEKKQKKKGKVGEKQKSPLAAEEDAKDDDNMTNSDIGDYSSEDNEKDTVSKQEAPQTEDEPDYDIEEVDAKDNTLNNDAANVEKVGDSGNNSKPGRKKGATKSSKSPSSFGKKKSDYKKKDEKDGEKSTKGKSSSKKSSRKQSVVSAKDREKNETNKKAKTGPSREEILEEVVKILKEVDFNTATLSDILKLLGAHFDVDLYSRKAEVKAIIAEVLNAMSDDDDEEEEGEDDANDHADSEDADN